MPYQKKQIYDLKDIEKKNSFIVPDGYFDNFSTRLNERIKIGKVESPASKRSRVLSFDRLALAASFIGFLILLFTGIKFLLKGDDLGEDQRIEIAEVIDYPIHEIDDQMLYELYTSTMTESQNEKIRENNDITDAMIEYLLNNNIDLQLIAQEL